MHQSPSAMTGVGGDPPRRGSPWLIAALLMVAILTSAGGGLLFAGLTSEPPRPPQPVADAAPPDLHHAQDPEDQTADTAGVAMRRSVPVRVRIPVINVDAKLISLGVDGEGEVEVPALDKAMDAGWYEHGPTPGEIGNAVIIGHVDSRTIGRAVFFTLGKLKPGDTIEVIRRDGSTATFRVDGVRSFPKAEFPAELVYGPSDRPSLRLVTCGGEFDKQARNYLENVIVFATLDI